MPLRWGYETENSSCDFTLYRWIGVDFRVILGEDRLAYVALVLGTFQQKTDLSKSMNESISVQQVGNSILVT